MEMEIKASMEIARKVLHRMAEFDIPFTPPNYQVWFEYYVGTNEKLVRDIDRIIESSVRFTPKLNHELHEKHFGIEENTRVLKQIERQTREILKGCLEQLIATTSSNRDHTEKLKVYRRKLDEVGSLPQMKHVLEDMKKDTAEMIESGLTLQKRLQEATRETEHLKRELNRATREAMIDPLTGLHNRRALEQKLRELFEDFRRKNRVFSVIMMDIDHFKVVNDRYGHKIGDELLQIVGATLFETLKGKDFPVRYGGEEFAVLLPDTVLADAYAVAEIIRTGIFNKKFKIKQTGERLRRLTVSLGVAQMQEGDTPETVLERADQALYLAKNSGRNNSKAEGMSATGQAKNIQTKPNKAPGGSI